ncbi:hypothetical protein [Streptomyces sp. NPDC005970]|uniref:hypothetical protein n=1 Tax=Streptomyces sp. NPDC005970 TaxID=3156723 RepID=UPI0033F3F2B5
MNAEAVDREVEALMLALTQEYGAAAQTLGGVSWLQAHYVPVRRLVTRIVRRLLALPEVPCRSVPAGPQDFVVAVDSAAFGYVMYDATETGISYLLGHHPEKDKEGVSADDGAVSLPPVLKPAPVCAVSWSSRHAETLLPVLLELADRGVRSTVVDLATEADQSFPDPLHAGISVLRTPKEALAHRGGLPAQALCHTNGGHVARVGRHEVSVARLARLVSKVLVHTSDSTQPSWTAGVKVEAWLDRVLAQLRAEVLLCSNDTSPLGVLAVRAAERAGADTVYVQHGAWIAGQISWRAQHCRHIAVMGARDVLTARAWDRRADARTYVVGQPRFDVLTKTDRRQQRELLQKALADQAGTAPPSIVVWACQPVREQRLRDQFEVLMEGLRNTAGRWGLVIAPHPAQSTTAFATLLDSVLGVDVALVGPEVGARGCLTGADALISRSSTCGIEAVLMDVPVLELALSSDRTLHLARHGAAQLCTSGEAIAVALARIEATPAAVRVPAAAKDSICRWDGHASAAIADIVVQALAEVHSSE